MRIVRTQAFARAIKALNVSESELSALETEIAANPDAGKVIKGLGGVRKIRFSMGGKGKRSGGRCAYLVLRLDDIAYLLLAYAKSQQTDLTQDQRKSILAFIEALP